MWDLQYRKLNNSARGIWLLRPGCFGPILCDDLDFLSRLTRRIEIKRLLSTGSMTTGSPGTRTSAVNHGPSL